MASTYKCYYCVFSTDEFHENIDHLVEQHYHQQVKYRELELNETTGKSGYRTKLLEDVVPANADISVTSDGRLCVHRHDRSKRKKSNTPQKPMSIPRPHHADTDQCYDSDDGDDSIHEEESGMGLLHLMEEMDLNMCSEEENNQNEDTDMAEILKRLPSIIEKLNEHGQLDMYLKWCSLVANDKFPMENIAYLLFLDVIQWFSETSSSQMRYFQTETKHFWQVGYRLFKGKFLRFMSGPRSIGQIVECSQDRGFCDPGQLKINFAVPSLQTMCQDKLEPIFPGVLTTTITAIAELSKYIKIGVDGKKVSRGKGKQMGDIDCWGFEMEPTLQECRERLAHEKSTVSEIYEQLRVYDMNELEIPSSKKQEIQGKLAGVVQVISYRIKDLRSVLLRLEFGIRKFMKRKFRNTYIPPLSKYAYITSTVHNSHVFFRVSPNTYNINLAN